MHVTFSRNKCPTFILLLVTYHDRMQFGEDRFVSIYRSQSISEGRQGKKSSRNVEAGLLTVHTASSLTQELTSQAKSCFGSGFVQRFTLTVINFNK